MVTYPLSQSRYVGYKQTCTLIEGDHHRRCERQKPSNGIWVLMYISPGEYPATFMYIGPITVFPS